MPNAYVDVETLKGTGVLNLTSTAFDTRLRVLIEAVSEGVNQFSNRYFYYLIETRTFGGGGTSTLLVPDLISIPASGIKEDPDMDGTYDTVWADADYILAPYNAAPTSRWGGPYTKIEVNTKSTGTQDEFLKGQRNYEITGTWGYWKVTADLGTGTLANSTATALTVSTLGTVAIGHSILADDEVVYVRGTAGTNTLLVDRAVNGSTATVHTGTALLKLVQYPMPVTEAVLIQTARLWQRRHSGFATEVGFPETGQMVVFRGLDADVKFMLGPYRKIPV